MTGLSDPGAGGALAAALLGAAAAHQAAGLQGDLASHLGLASHILGMVPIGGRQPWQHQNRAFGRNGRFAPAMVNKPGHMNSWTPNTVTGVWYGSGGRGGGVYHGPSGSQSQTT